MIKLGHHHFAVVSRMTRVMIVSGSKSTGERLMRRVTADGWFVLTKLEPSDHSLRAQKKISMLMWWDRMWQTIYERFLFLKKIWTKLDLACRSAQATEGHVKWYRQNTVSEDKQVIRKKEEGGPCEKRFRKCSRLQCVDGLWIQFCQTSS